MILKDDLQYIFIGEYVSYMLIGFMKLLLYIIYLIILNS